MKRTLIFAFAVTATFALAQDPIVSAQQRISLDNLSTFQNETSAVSSANGQEIIGGWNDYRSDGSIKAGFGVTSDGGATWAHVLVRPPVANQATVEGDPMAFVDPRTGTIFAGAISFAGNGGIYIAKKTPGQNTFGPSVMARTNGSTDKEWGCAGPLPGNPDTTRLYIAFNQGIIRSDNLGTTWTTPLSLGSGLGFLPRVGPNGEVYVTYWDTSLGIKFRRSLDGGLTFNPAINAATRLATWGVQNYGIPGQFRDAPIHTMAVNPVTGAIVIVYFDQTNIVNGQRNLDLYLTRSTNQGTSWSTPTRLFRPINQVSDMIFPWVEYTKDGRLHLIAFDTSNNLNQTDGLVNGFFDQTYWYSQDDGQNFSNGVRLGPSSWNAATGNFAFMGDYQGIAISDKSVFPMYPDTRPGQSKAFVNKIYNPIERPASFSLFRGILVGGTLNSLFAKDNDAMVVKRGPTVNSSEAPIQLETTTVGILSSNPTSLKVFLWTSVGSVNIQQQVQMFNINTSQWDVVDTRPATTTESNTDVVVPTPVNYITPGSGTARCRVAFKSIGPVSNSAWTATINQDVLLVVP